MSDGQGFSTILWPNRSGFAITLAVALEGETMECTPMWYQHGVNAYDNINNTVDIWMVFITFTKFFDKPNICYRAMFINTMVSTKIKDICSMSVDLRQDLHQNLQSVKQEHDIQIFMTVAQRTLIDLATEQCQFLWRGERQPALLHSRTHLRVSTRANVATEHDHSNIAFVLHQCYSTRWCAYVILARMKSQQRTSTNVNQPSITTKRKPRSCLHYFEGKGK